MSITTHSYLVLSPVAFTVHLEPYKMLALLSFVHLDSFHRILCRPPCLGHRCNMSTFSLGKKKILHFLAVRHADVHARTNTHASHPCKGQQYFLLLLSSVDVCHTNPPPPDVVHEISVPFGLLGF